MRILYYIGEEIDKNTILKKGFINESIRPIKISAEDTIVLDNLSYVELYKPNSAGTMIKLRNGTMTVFLVVPRIFLNIGTGFVIGNYLATTKLKNILESTI